MWQCPECQRTFKNENQHHFCGETNSVDQYIAKQATEVRPLLDAIRREIRKAAPDAIEKIAWQMPTYWQSENLIHFAAAKKHIGIYPGEEAIRVFADRLTGLITSKGAIRLPLDQPLDLLLVRDIVRWRVAKVSGEE
ncbi:MAG TPA: hypothetical protein GXZ89_06235 [Fastidiosipila sp.]|jgi:uncharacterized protein YdhG (YjbR/CyaY superfamily)|nr:hypothetical protein [Fastidiosipila sp.]